MKRLSPWAALLVFASCQTPQEPPPEPHHPQEQSLGAPNDDSQARILARLRARHPEDSVTPEDVAKIPRARESLLHYATQGNPLNVRARALEALAYVPDEEALQVLLDALHKPKYPASLRLAALRGLQGHLPNERAQQALSDLAQSGDPELAPRALELLQPVAPP